MRILALPLRLTPLSITVTRFAQDGMPVKSMAVPEVEATAVPSVNGLTVGISAVVATETPSLSNPFGKLGAPVPAASVIEFARISDIS
jgi:hypothetical protein